mmetsp:Transcript_18238/g.43816  ORF Transcript_18238/g.43816 Transcript_18238/m.43816 type:complete len:402 (-) Transcript_18238:104-1309(-)
MHDQRHQHPRHQPVGRRTDAGLQRRGHAPALGRLIQHQQGHDRHHQGPAEREQADQRQGPEGAERRDQVQRDVDRRHRRHDAKATHDLALGRHAAGQSPAECGAGHDAADAADEEPEELRRLEMQVLAEEDRSGQHIEKHAVERHAAGEHQHHEPRAAAEAAVLPQQGGRMKGLHHAGVQGLGQQPPVGDPQRRPHRRQEPEDRMPVGMHKQEATDDRRYRRRDAEEQRHLGHDPLRIRRREHVADDGPRHDDTGAGGQALHRAPEHQLADAARHRTAHAGQREHRQADQHHRATAEAVRQRPVEQVHEGEAEQIGGQRLLHLQRRRIQRRGNAGEGRQIGVDREGPDHGQTGQQHGQGPAGRAPQAASVRIHRAKARGKAVSLARRPAPRRSPEKSEASR